MTLKLSIGDTPPGDAFGRCIAYIVDGDDQVPIWLDPEGIYDGIDLTLTRNPNRTLFPCFAPRSEEHNNRIFISAPTGSGKTFFTGSMIMEYKNRDPDKKVYIFSPYEQDKSIDERIDEKDYVRITPDDYKLEKMADSLVVLDDIECLENDIQQRNVNKMTRRLLQAGRHHKIDTVVINHTLMDFAKTKKIIGESNFIILFPNNGNDAEITRYCKTYIGLSKPEIEKIIRVKDSRWVMIHKGSPFYIVTEKRIYFPNQ